MKLRCYLAILNSAICLMPALAAQNEGAMLNEYLEKMAACRDAYRVRHYFEAESLCEAALKLADQLLPQRKLERMTAHAMYGQILIAEHKLPEALVQTQQELSIAETFMKSDDPDLGYAYYHEAIALHMNAKVQSALVHYKEAEEILRQAVEHAADESLKNQYAATLGQVVKAHAALLRQTGHAAAAAELEHEASRTK